MIEKPTQPKIYTPQDGSCVLNLDARDVRGSKIYDRSGKGNHGDITGAVVKPQNYGLPALSFDGVDDRVVIPYDASINNPDVVSFNIWVKLSATAGIDRIINNLINSWNFYTDGSTTAVMNGKINGSDFWTTVGVLSLTKWTMLSFSYDKDGGANNLKIFLNGVQVAQATKTGSFANDNTKDLRLGTEVTWNYYVGLMDFVKIWNRVITPSEISQYFNNTKHLYGR